MTEIKEIATKEIILVDGKRYVSYQMAETISRKNWATWWSWAKDKFVPSVKYHNKGYVEELKVRQYENCLMFNEAIKIVREKTELKAHKKMIYAWADKDENPDLNFLITILPGGERCILESELMKILNNTEFIDSLVKYNSKFDKKSQSKKEYTKKEKPRVQPEITQKIKLQKTLEEKTTQIPIKPKKLELNKKKVFTIPDEILAEKIKEKLNFYQKDLNTNFIQWMRDRGYYPCLENAQDPSLLPEYDKLRGYAREYLISLK